MLAVLILPFILLLNPGNRDEFQSKTRACDSQHHLFARVHIAPSFASAVSGRMLIFIAPGTGAPAVDANVLAPKSVYVAAKEVSGIMPGGEVDVDLDGDVFPAPVSTLAPGDFQLQAVLDVNHNYSYSGRGAGDLLSDVLPLKSWDPLSSAPIDVTLNATEPEKPQNPMPKMSSDELQSFQSAIKPMEFRSRVLSEFWGRPVIMRGEVLLPPGYSARSPGHYPTVYFTHGFGADLQFLNAMAPRLYLRMLQKKMPEMIWVMLDESTPAGTHEFADSKNNGPWGRALTAELIPYLEKQYRMDAQPAGRFLLGHSSGGWAALWLQVTYPSTFGGAWATSPDAADFHDFLGADLYAPHANVYHNANGEPYPLIRDGGKVLAITQEFAELEETLGEIGGQMASFEWVFSPRGPDGRPLPLFNRKTGDVDPAVAAYWREHYDIAGILGRNWLALRPGLKGKIHVIVGTADTFYLDGPAHKLQAVLDKLQANAHFTFVQNRSHFDLYGIGDDPNGLFNTMASEMYLVARPASRRTSGGGHVKSKHH